MIGHLLAFAIPAAYTLLPPAMNSMAATAMLAAIALQESKAQWRRQIGGPARGFWQFERGGGVVGVLTHPSTQHTIESVCGQLRYPVHPDQCYMAIEHNDVLAACFARCLLWTLPDPLPLEGDADEAWRQYLRAWRPGKPHPDAWAANYARAWDLASRGTDQ